MFRKAVLALSLLLAFSSCSSKDSPTTSIPTSTSSDPFSNPSQGPFAPITPTCEHALEPVRVFMSSHEHAVLDDDLRHELRKVAKRAYEICQTEEFSTFQATELVPWGNGLIRPLRG